MYNCRTTWAILNESSACKYYNCQSTWVILNNSITISQAYWYTWSNKSACSMIQLNACWLVYGRATPQNNLYYNDSTTWSYACWCWFIQSSDNLFYNVYLCILIFIVELKFIKISRSVEIHVDCRTSTVELSLSSYTSTVKLSPSCYIACSKLSHNILGSISYKITNWNYKLAQTTVVDGEFA